MTSTTRRHWLTLGLIVVVGFALRVYAIGADPFWLDEAHSANFIRLSIPEIWSWADPYDKGNPPGYTTLLKVWAQVSVSDGWLRLFSALAGTATLPVVYLIGRRVSGRRSALVATALVALSGYHLRFSQEARTYALMALLTGIVLAAVAQLLAQPNGDDATRIRGDRPWQVRSEGLGLRRPLTWTDIAWPAYALGAGVAFLLHNTGIALAVSANLAVIVWWTRSRPRPPRFARNWIVANLGVAAIWMTWIPGFLRQLESVTASWWVPSPTLFSVAQGAADLASPSFGWNLPWNGQNWWAVLAMTVVLAVCWLGTRTMSSGHRLMIWAFLLTLPVIEIAFSLRRPIFLTRTLVGLVVPGAVAVAAAVTSLRTRPATVAAVAAAIAISTSGVVAYHLTYDKTAWDEVAEFVASEATAEDLVLVQPANTIVAFNHYYDRTAAPAPAYGAPSKIPGRVDRGSQVTPSDRGVVETLAVSHRSIWLVLNRPDPGESLEPTLAGVRGDGEIHRFEDLILIKFGQ